MPQKPTILVTCFEPFWGREKNASLEAVKLLSGEAGGCTVVRRTLPVRWHDCIAELDRAIFETRPRGVLSVGEAGTLPPVRIERMGHNIARGPDGDFQSDLYDRPIFANGPAAYFTTFPYAAMANRLRQENVSVSYSFSAGQYLCNCVTYTALHLAAVRYPFMTAGFVHLPMLPGSGQEGGMTAEQSARALALCLEEYARELSAPVRSLEEYRGAL